MTLDRTKTPPGTELERRMTPYGPEYTVSIAPMVFAQSEEAAVMLAWHAYDEITLPARVALLRELAAEFEEDNSTLQQTAGEYSDRAAEELRRRADQLEGKP